MGNRVRELRQARKMTMKQLGEVLGVAESTISQYETGKRQMDNETLLRLGEFFDVTVGYILGAETKKAPTQEGEQLQLSGTYLRLAKGAQELGLDDDDVDAILALYKKHREKNK